MAYPVLSIRSLTKSFGTVRALSGVDIDVWQGETIGVTGPSSSGKSTFLLCVARILKPDFGSISSIEVAYVPPQPVFYPFLTVRDALSCFTRGHSRCIDSSIDRMLLHNHVRERICTLDSGQVLCVALAQAIVGRPRVLLLDAPLDGMDLASARIGRAAIIRAAEAVSAVIITTREGANLTGITSRNVFMRHGQFSAGTPKERLVTRVAERQH